MSGSLIEIVDSVEQRLLEADLFFGHGTDNAFDEAAWLVCHASGIDLETDDEPPWEDPLNQRQKDSVEKLLQLRLDTRKPLAYLINEAWFAGERFYIDERAIVPRSHLGEWIPEQFSPWLAGAEPERILDLCTGSGCIAIALAKAFVNATVDASDVSDQALQVASRNVESHGVAARLNLLQGDLLGAVQGRTYDLIVCNPPYVADELMQELPDEYEFEPELAFKGGKTGLDLIENIIEQAPAHLNEGGVLIVEAGSAREVLENAYPEVPFTWLSSANGDAVIFLFGAEDISRYFAN